MKRQKCNKCFIIKSFTDFSCYKSSKGILKLKKECKTCKSVYDRQKFLKNKEKILQQCKGYRELNKNRISERNKIRRLENNEEINRQQRIRYSKNPKAQLESSQRWVSKNREKNRKHKAEYNRKKRRNNIQFKLAERLRGRLRSAIKYGIKVGSGVRDLGCNLDEFKQYIESKFQFGMAWDNHGSYGWHLDHIKPLKDFDLTDRKQLLKACHYTNIQPLWWQDNLSKNRRINRIVNA